MLPIIPFGSPSRYRINQSLRFRASNSANLLRVPSAASNRRTWTFSTWVKRGGIGAARRILSTYQSNNDNQAFNIFFDASDRLNIVGWSTFWRTTNAVYRDPTAWMHIVVTVDTTDATANNRVRLWVNGAEVTSFSALNNPSLNADLGVNTTGSHRLGVEAFDLTAYFDGYMAEVHFIDGQALTPSSFGQTDPSTNSWTPRRYTGTYGTNGFYLPFNDAASTTTISQDRSGNGNNWTSSGISVTSGVTFDQMTDTPTNNFPTLNPLDVRNVGSRTFEAANLNLVLAGNGGARVTQALPTSGKWYWEVTCVSTSGGNKGVGLGTALGDISGAVIPTECITYNANGNTTQAGAYVASGYATQANGDIIGIAYDADANTVRFYRNNVAQGGSALSTSGMTAPLFPLTANPAPAATDAYNFGQRAFAYTPPTGFVALNTANIPTPTIQRGDDGMQATLRTGTGASASVSSLRFQPDLVWIKSRSNATNHNLFDAVRGVNNGLVSNSTAAEYADANSLTAFNSNGYSLGTDGSSRGVNINTNTYVDWAWREGVAYGFDIVTDTGTGVAKTVAHALNAVPHMIIRKDRGSGTGHWYVYHRARPASEAGILQLTNAFGASTAWNSVTPTSSVFSVGSAVDENRNGGSYINYLWTSIPGFSLFGSYTGNGSADGPFVWCGFRPRFVMIKRVDSTGAWALNDAARDPENVVDALLNANTAGAESTFTALDFTANGFKMRNTDSGYNASGGTYIFAAFAENPFKFSNAR